jgi:chromosome segregation ATPase
MSIKDLIDKVTVELEQITKEADRLWAELGEAEGRIKPLRDRWHREYSRRDQLTLKLSVLRELADEQDHTAEQIEQDWPE